MKEIIKFLFKPTKQTLPDDIVRVYMVTMGRINKNMYFMKAEDAMTFCSLPDTKGNNWMFCWSKYDLDEPNRTTWMVDDGRYDDIMKKYNIMVIKKLT